MINGILKSTLLVQLGNIAYRVGRTHKIIMCFHIINDKNALINSPIYYQAHQTIIIVCSQF